MNWFKCSKMQPSIIVSAYNSLGEMWVLINGKRYKYEKVSPYQKDQLERYIKFKNWSSAFQLIRSLQLEEKPVKEQELKQKEFNF